MLLAAVRGYQLFVSPLLLGGCRFTPSCSAYAAEALRSYGAVTGSWLAVRRLARCHPFSRGGHDPVLNPRTAVTPDFSHVTAVARDVSPGTDSTK